jgi:hypothetical protein
VVKYELMEISFKPFISLINPLPTLLTILNDSRLLVTPIFILFTLLFFSFLPGWIYDTA